MRQRWKRRLCVLLGTLFLLGSLWTIPAAAAETAAPQTTAAESQSSDNAKDSGKTKQIVIVVFTVSCGVTAFLVMQPSLKKLKAAKEQAKTVSAEQTKKDH